MSRSPLPRRRLLDCLAVLVFAQLLVLTKGQELSPSCADHPKCASLNGDCCPAHGGIYLFCCALPVPTVPPTLGNKTKLGPKCDEYPGCQGLWGDCCPTDTGIQLDCCTAEKPHTAQAVCHKSVGCADIADACCPAANGDFLPCCHALSSCTVLPGIYGLLVQGVLAAISVGVLSAKYLFVEKRKPKEVQRTAQEFGLDSAKQIFGAGWIHAANMLCAILFTQTTIYIDQCTAYWMNIMIDTTVGIFIEYILLRFVNVVVARDSEWRSGEYMEQNANTVGKTMNYMRFVKQLFVWATVVTLMKVVVVCMITYIHPIAAVASEVLQRFDSDPFRKLLVVMVFTPCVMNAFQFFVTDIILQKKSEPAKAEEPLLAKGNKVEDTG